MHKTPIVSVKGVLRLDLIFCIELKIIFAHHIVWFSFRVAKLNIITILNLEKNKITLKKNACIACIACTSN